MEFRRSGNGGQRRRRVLFEDANRSSEVATTSSGSPIRRAQSSDSYAEAARMDCQARVTDVVPIRALSLVLVFLGGIAVIVGLQMLHHHRSTWSLTVGAGYLSALDLTRPGNLAAWYSSFVLLCAACASLLIYTIRRHNVDDYRAHYRIWLWAGFLMFCASIDAVTGIHAVAQGLLIQLTKQTLYQDGDIWWMLLVFVAAILPAVLLIRDMRYSLLATTALIIAAVHYATSAALQLNFPILVGRPLHVVAVSFTTLMGHLMLLMSMLLYARHIFLAAEGRLPVQTAGSKKRSQSRKSASAEAPKKSTGGQRQPRFGEAAAVGKRVSRKSDLVSEPVSNDVVQGRDAEPTGDPIDSNDGTRKLSKSERRRMRKQMKRLRQAG